MSGSSSRLHDGELEAEALGIAKRSAPVDARDRDAFAAKPLAPRSRAPLREATRQTTRWTMPAPARPRLAPGYSKNVMSEPAEPRSSA